MKRIILTLISLFAVCFFTSCEKPVEPKKPVLPPIDEESPIFKDLINIKWKLVEFADFKDSVFRVPTPNEDRCYWIEFYENGSLKGYTSANTLNGSYTITDGVKILYQNFFKQM